MSVEDFFRSRGLDPKTGQNPLHASGGAFRAVPTSPSTLSFVFYVMMDGNPFFVVLAGSSPIIEHNSSTTAPAEAALEAMLKRGLVRLETGKPTVIHSVYRLFGKPVIHFVQVDEAELASQGHSFFGSKVYSLVTPSTGKSQGGKDASLHGFGVMEYREMLSAFSTTLSSASLPSLAGFALGGGGGSAVALPKPTRLGGGAAHSSPSHGHSIRLTKVDKMGVVNHVFCMIRLIDGSFLFVQGTDGNWGPPGGHVDKGEISWNAVKREVFEETKSMLPRLDGQPLGSTTHEPLKFHWEHDRSTSGFYCGSSNASYHDFLLNFRRSEEINSVGAFTVQELWQLVHSRHADFRLRPCAIESTRALLIALGFPERS